MIHPTIAALANQAVTGELQNVKVGEPLRVRQSPVRADIVGAMSAFEKLKSYKVGDSRESLLVIEEAVRQSQYNDEDHAAMCKMLAGIVGSDATNDAKAFACRQLWMIGTQAEIPALAAAVKDPATTNAARYALQNMEYPEVDDALIAALDGTDPKVQIGCINSLAHRKSDKALDAIKPLKKSKNKEVAAAAKHAIARLDGKLV